jgi:hypothetical protein
MASRIICPGPLGRRDTPRTRWVDRRAASAARVERRRGRRRCVEPGAERDNALRVWIEGPTAIFGDDDSPTLVLRAGRARQTLVAGYGEGNGERYRWLFLGDGRALGPLTRADRVELRVGRSLRVQLPGNPIGVLSTARDELERSYAALGAELDGEPPSP